MPNAIIRPAPPSEKIFSKKVFHTCVISQMWYNKKRRGEVRWESTSKPTCPPRNWRSTKWQRSRATGTPPCISHSTSSRPAQPRWTFGIWMRWHRHRSNRCGKFFANWKKATCRMMTNFIARTKLLSVAAGFLIWAFLCERVTKEMRYVLWLDFHQIHFQAAWMTFSIN